MLLSIKTPGLTECIRFIYLCKIQRKVLKFISISSQTFIVLYFYLKNKNIYKGE